jgi:hypothetical protein
MIWWCIIAWHRNIYIYIHTHGESLLSIYWMIIVIQHIGWQWAVTTRNLTFYDAFYRHNKCFFITKDHLWRSGDENKNVTDGVSLNTFCDILIKERHKQFYDYGEKNVISYLHKTMTWQLTWQVTYSWCGKWHVIWRAIDMARRCGNFLVTNLIIINN